MLIKIGVSGNLDCVSWRRVTDILENLLPPFPGSELDTIFPDCAVLDYDDRGIRLMLTNRRGGIYQKN